MLGTSGEDYIKAVLVLRTELGYCRNIDISTLLDVSKASVTRALANLSSCGLIDMVNHDVRLTPEGERLATAILEKYRFFERLLRDAGVDERIALEEACRMEHCLSEDSFRKLLRYLGG